MKFFKKIGYRYAAIIIYLIMLIVTCSGCESNVFQSSIFDLGIIKAVNNGKANKDLITAESNGIKIEITTTVSDKSRTVFELNIYGLSKNVNSPTVIENIILIDDEYNSYQFNRCAGDSKFTDNVVVNSLEFYGGPGKNMNLYLSFDSVDGIAGNWNFEIPVKHFEEKSYITNIKYGANGEIWIINKIDVYASKTVVQGVIEKTKDWNFTMELENEGNIFKGFHCVVPDREFPTSFVCDLEPMEIDKDIKLYIVDLNSRNDRYRVVIDIPFSQLEEILLDN